MFTARDTEANCASRGRLLNREVVKLLLGVVRRIRRLESIQRRVTKKWMIHSSGIAVSVPFGNAKNGRLFFLVCILGFERIWEASGQ